MEKRALVIGVERYLEEKDLENVIYAEGDAKAMSEALGKLGFQVNLLTNERATTGRILSAVRQLATATGKGDELAIFFVGQSVSSEGENYLLGHDTVAEDVAGTAASLRKIFLCLTGSKAGRVILFLDCCLEDTELKELLDKERHLAFSACGRNEKSWPSISHRHRHWTYQLLAALRGDKPEILRNGTLLSGPLQDFLREAVPREMALQRADGRTQTPQMWGEDKFPVADLTKVLATKDGPAIAPLGLKQAMFERIEAGAIKSLSGFVKGQTLPKQSNSWGENFVRQAAEPDVRKEIEEMFAIIQGSKKYKTRELKAGNGGVMTPDFFFSVEYAQDKDDPARYVLTRHLENFRNVALLEEDWFTQCFREKFDSITLALSGPLDVEAVIDAAEDLEGATVSTDMEKSQCAIKLALFAGRIIVRPDAITFAFGGLLPPKELFRRFELGMRSLGQIDPVVTSLER